MTAAPPAVLVQRARVRNAVQGDRARLEMALDAASPAATGVSEHALLLIRRLRIERPLALVGQEAFAGELIDRIRAAKVTARRDHGGPQDDLYFEDEIALELAIIRTWLGGERLAQTVRKAIDWSAEPVTRWRRKLLGEMRLLPRLVVALMEAGLAAAWFGHFEDGEITAAANAILRAHGVPPILGGTGKSLADSARPTRAQPLPGHQTALPSALAEPIAIARGMTLRPSLRVLAAITLVAVRRPELLSTGRFRAAVSGLQAELPGQSTLTSQAAAIAAHTGASADQQSGATAAAEPAAIATPVPKIRLTPARNRTGSRAQPSQPPARSALAALPRPISPAELLRDQPAACTMPVPSAFAGLLFLLNIFLVLGLYSNLTDPARQLRGLSPFELLLLLGRRWFGRAFVGDPLERLLRSFAGLAPNERLGRNFDAPVWSVPSGWLDPWPRCRTRKIARAYGVSRWHPAGFPLADRWSTDRSPAWLRRRWVACLARYVEARLACALGTSDPGAALATLARRHGTITAEGDRIDIGFALDNHPLALRLAGLDRDPGWIPAAGRSFRFHFT